MYALFNVGGQELKCKLNTRNTIALEKKLGENPLNVFMAVNDGKIPTLEVMAMIIHQSLQAMEHGYTLEKVYDLLDIYFEDGKTIIDLMPLLMEIFTVSGFFKKAE